ncbi:MAG: hypothetical protein ACT4QC_13785 [Planctomycetaceae bacterium]
MLHRISIAALVVSLTWGIARGAQEHAGLTQRGKPDLKSAGPLAFGPPGVLFVGDTQGAALFAIGVDPAAGKPPASGIRVDALDKKLSGMLGIKPDELLINDIAVQPRSGVVYLSASRGRGPAAEPVIATIGADGSPSVLPLDYVAYAKVSLNNVPGAEDKDRRGAPLRQDSITDLNYLDGKVFIAGLSNEEFASKLRGIPFPFAAADAGTSVEIYHGAHGGYETRAPVRTFVPFVVNGEAHLLAAYQCTPLVSFPLAQLKPGVGSKVRGKTVAELGNMNRPLDIIAYEKDGHPYLLLANDRRGVMKIKVEGIADQTAIEERINGTSGLDYETIGGLKGVEQLDKLDAGHAVILVRADDASLRIETIALP